MPRPLELPCDFDPIEHIYRDTRGRSYPSVTQILSEAECSDFSMVDPEVLKAAAARGTRVHHLTALWDKVRRTQELATFFEAEQVAPEHRGYVEQYECFLQRSYFQPIPEESERPRLVEIHNTMVGMTPDRVGYFPPSRQKAVLDIKTGSFQLSHPLQVAGYSLGIERVLQLAIRHERLALYLEPTYYRLQWFTNPQDYYAFLDALNGGGKYLQLWKINRTRKRA